MILLNTHAIQLSFVILFTNHVKSKIGGVTGDILGAIVELNEVVVLISLLALKIEAVQIYVFQQMGSVMRLE